MEISFSDVFFSVFFGTAGITETCKFVRVYLLCSLIFWFSVMLVKVLLSVIVLLLAGFFFAVLSLMKFNTASLVCWFCFLLRELKLTFLGFVMGALLLDET